MYYTKHFFFGYLHLKRECRRLEETAWLVKCSLTVQAWGPELSLWPRVKAGSAQVSSLPADGEGQEDLWACWTGAKWNQCAPGWKELASKHKGGEVIEGQHLMPTLASTCVPTGTHSLTNTHRIIIFLKIKTKKSYKYQVPNKEKGSSFQHSRRNIIRRQRNFK